MDNTPWTKFCLLKIEKTLNLVVVPRLSSQRAKGKITIVLKEKGVEAGDFEQNT
jgi:hypothetical protein